MTLSAWLRAAPRGMLVSVLIAFVFLNGLGVWQLYRLHWKEGLIADMARTEAQAPVPVAQLLAQAKPDWRSASLSTCTVDPAKAIYMHSEVDATPGYRVLSACPAAPGQPLILIDLGFTTEAKLGSETLTFAPVGRLRPADKPSAFAPVNRPADHDWYTRSTVDIGKALNVSLRSDYFLVLDLTRSHLDIAGLQQGPLSAPLPNRHFEYALTWFGLAWVMIGIVIAFVAQRVKGATGTYE